MTGKLTSLSLPPSLPPSQPYQSATTCQPPLPPALLYLFDLLPACHLAPAAVLILSANKLSMTDLGAGFFFHITHFLSYFWDCILWNCHKVSVTKKRVFSYKRKDNSALFFGLGKNFPIWKEMVSLIFRLFLILSLYARCLGVTNNMPQKPSPLMADSPSPSCSPPVK